MPMDTYVYLYYMSFYSHVWTSAAQTTVEHELYQGQSTVGNMLFRICTLMSIIALNYGLLCFIDPPWL